MTFVIDSDQIEVPPDQLVLFWAGIPHQLTRITANSETADGLSPHAMRAKYTQLELR